MGQKNSGKFFNDPATINPQTGQLLHPPPVRAAAGRAGYPPITALPFLTRNATRTAAYRALLLLPSARGSFPGQVNLDFC